MISNISKQIFNCFTIPINNGFSFNFYLNLMPNGDLNNQIKDLKNRTISNYESSDLTILKTALIRSQNFGGKSLLHSLADLPLEATLKAIDSLLEDGSKIHHIQHLLMNLLSCVKPENLNSHLKLNIEQMEKAIEMEALLKDELLKHLIQTTGKPLWNKVVNSAVKYFHHFIEIIIGLTGLNSMQDAEGYIVGNMSSDYAQTILKMYWTSLTYPTVLFGTFFALVGSSTLAVLLTIGSIVGALSFIPIYKRYLKPCPTSCYPLENINKKMTETLHSPIFKRREIIEKIQNSFLCGKGVILTAAPGVGKTTIVNSLAELIVSRECHKNLYHAQVFSVNSTELEKNGFNNIKATFLGYPKDFILFLDEAHCLFNPDANSKRPVDSLLTFHHSLSQVICATTTQQYEEMIQDDKGGFNRRFNRISVSPLKDADIESALYELLHFKAPQLELEEAVIPYIVKNAKNFDATTSKIDAASALLSEAIIKTTVISFEDLTSRINELDFHLQGLKNKNLHEHCSQTINSYDNYQQLQREKDNIEKDLKNKNKKLEEVTKLEKICLKLKQANYQLAYQAKENPALQKQWMMNKICHQTVVQFMSRTREKLGIPTQINHQLVDSILEGRCSLKK